MNLHEALRIQRGDVVSFIGAGGKTSALFRLGRELAARGWRVVATTTTRVAADELHLAPLALPVDGGGWRPVARGLNKHNFVFLYSQIKEGKALGVDPDMVRRLLDRLNSDVLLIEADGARRLPFKAPYDSEPVLPAETTHVVLCTGLDVLGQPLDDHHVYNVDAMIRRYGYPVGAPVAWPWVASVLRDEQLGLLNVPPDVPVTVLLNKIPAEGILRRRARLIASLLLRSSRIHAVAIGAVQADDPVHEVRRPVGAVVLAAGLSTRMRDFKVLLPWGRETVLESILRRLIVSRLDRVVVVTGREALHVQAIAAQYGVDAAHNPDYRTGEMLSSLQVGLRAMPARFDGALVVLGDQPQIQGYVISRVLDAYAAGQGSIAIPSFMMRRGHPVLFGRGHWPALLELPPGSSPRDLVNAHADAIVYVPVNTDSILKDIDTPDDYRSALRYEGLE